MINGISHITLIVRDLEIAGSFVCKIFDAEEIYASGEKRFSIANEKYFQIAGVWICLMEGDNLPEKSYSHIAFSISDNEFDTYVKKIEAAGAVVLPGRPRVQGEGRSIYFYDLDNHLFELHTGTLEERLQCYKA